MNLKQSIFYVAISAIVVGCMQNPNRTSNDLELIKKPIDTEVPASFDWKTTKDITVVGNINDQYNGRYAYKVNVYAENPITNPNAALIKGVSTKSTINVVLTIPQGLKTIYVVQIDPLSRTVVQTAQVNGNEAKIDFSSSVVSVNSSLKASKGASGSTITIPSTPSDAIVLSGSSKVNIETGLSYVIPKNTIFSGDVNFAGEGNVNLFVEGEWVVGKKTMIIQNNTQIIVQSTGSVVSVEDCKLNFVNKSSLMVAFGGKINASDMEFHIADQEGSIITLGDVSVDGVYFNNGGKLTNQGTLKIEEALSSKSGTIIINAGTLVASNVDAIGGTITNDGMIQVGRLNLKSNNATFVNNSVLIIEENANFGYINFNNNCFVGFRDGAKFNVEGSILNISDKASFFCYDVEAIKSQINLGDKSMFEARNNMGTQNGTIFKGVGKAQSLVRLKTLNAKTWEAIIYDGVQVETKTHTKNNGERDPGYVLKDNASMVAWGKSTIAIEANECSGKGNNPDQGTGNEGDQDEDTIYDQAYTYLFEDNWPHLGDYDMNDAVIELTSYKESVKNKSIQFNFKLINIGASKEIGAGIQIDGLAKSQIDRVVTSTGLVAENDQKSLVVPLFIDGHAFLGEQAGKPTDNVSSKDITVEVVFTNAADVTAFKVSSLNMYITTKDNVSAGKRKEIHLCGYTPTDKAETAMFGKYDDNSNVTFFKSKSNYVWGLMVPTKFAYPKESVNIVNAYSDFTNWISSGGTQNQDWYNNGNTDNIVK